MIGGRHRKPDDREESALSQFIAQQPREISYIQTGAIAALAAPSGGVNDRLYPPKSADAPRAASSVSAMAPAIIRRVREELQHLEDFTPSLADVADRLHLSERTLRRRLRELDTSYRQVLDDVRFARAAEKLCQCDTTNDALAELLGYTDTANFRRAFKRWAGRSPQAFRQLALGQ